MKPLNISGVKVGAEKRAEAGGRKRFKNSYTSIGPTKKGPISFVRHDKTSFQSSYFVLNRSVVEFLMCTGVLNIDDNARGVFEGGVVWGGVVGGVLIGGSWELVATCRLKG